MTKIRHQADSFFRTLAVEPCLVVGWSRRKPPQQSDLNKSRATWANFSRQGLEPHWNHWNQQNYAKLLRVKFCFTQKSRADLLRNLPTYSCRPEATAKPPLLKRSSILWNAPAKSPIIRDAFTKKRWILDPEDKVVFSLPVNVSFFPCTMSVFITNDHGIPLIFCPASSIMPLKMSKRL